MRRIQLFPALWVGGENSGVDPVPTTCHPTRRSGWSCGANGAGFVVAGAMALLLAVAVARPAVGESVEGSSELRVLTYNVWHGLRSGESNKRFPGEEAGRKDRRFEQQIEEIQKLDPHVLLLQEVNPNQREARKYAKALGYDEIHKVTSCGVHIGKLYKIPRNVNEGLAILAKPELGLRREGSKRLSGNAWCTASFGFQTKESRFALFGSIEFGGRRILLASTHLFSPRFMPEGFRKGLDDLVVTGTVTAAQRDEIVGFLDARSARNVREVEILVAEMERRGKKVAVGESAAPVVVGGDFNTEPGTPGVGVLERAGYRSRSRTDSSAGLETWDPVTNHVNYDIGTKRSDPVPTFGIEAIRELFAPRTSIARQIDHVFVSTGSIEIDRVLDESVQDLYLSDHFGLLARVALPRAR